jgi:hypothetical protein
LVPYTSPTFINGLEEDMGCSLIGFTDGTKLGGFINAIDSSVEIQNVLNKLSPTQNNEMQSG